MTPILLATEGLESFYFRQPWPIAVMVSLIAIALAVSAFVYGAERSLALWKRILLGTVRAVLFILIILLLFEPVGATSKRDTQPSNILVLLDVSGSMAFADNRKRPEDLEEAALALGKITFKDRTPTESAGLPAYSATRLAMAQGILDHPELKFFRAPGGKYRMRYFSFGERLEPAPDKPDDFSKWLKEAKAEAPATRLGEALQQAVERYSGQPVAGIVLLTDGASNEGIDPLEAARALHVPIFPVGLGLPRSDDVRLVTVTLPEAVFPKDKVPVRVQIQSTPAFVGRPVTLTVKSEGRELDRKTLTLTGENQFDELAFVPGQGSGIMRLEVAVSPLSGEATEENNRAARSVKIIDEKIKVLYVEGKPRWEYRYLRAVLLRDHRMTVKFLMTEGDQDLARASDQYVDRFPEDEASAFKYDLVIVGDVPADFFTPAQLTWLDKLVREQGGSFLMLGGHKYAPMTYLDTPIAGLLPVKLTARGRELVDPGVHPVVTPAGAQSAIMALEESAADNQAAWSLVKPLYDVPRLDGAKPGATVLATLSDRADNSKPYPLVAWQRYGSGKSMFVAADKLWRLRFKRGDAYHARFWGQAIQFLTLSRLLGENKRVRLETDGKNYRAGDRVLVQAKLLDEEYHPVKAESYQVRIEQVPPKGEPRTLTLKPVPAGAGLFQGFFTPEEAGDFQVRPAPRDEPHANQADFKVESVSREKLEPNLQKEKLQKLAELSGGKYLAVRDLPTLPDLMPDQSRIVKLPPQERELWNNWMVFFVIMSLAGMEWFLRRRYDMA